MEHPNEVAAFLKLVDSLFSLTSSSPLLFCSSFLPQLLFSHPSLCLHSSLFLLFTDGGLPKIKQIFIIIACGDAHTEIGWYCSWYRAMREVTPKLADIAPDIALCARSHRNWLILLLISRYARGHPWNAKTPPWTPSQVTLRHDPLF